MRIRSASVLSDSGLYLYALLPALFILQKDTSGYVACEALWTGFRQHTAPFSCLAPCEELRHRSELSGQPQEGAALSHHRSTVPSVSCA